jgi:hypothetical protein
MLYIDLIPVSVLLSNGQEFYALCRYQQGYRGNLNAFSSKIHVNPMIEHECFMDFY